MLIMKIYLFLLYVILSVEGLAQIKQDPYELVDRITLRPGISCMNGECLLSPNEEYLITSVDHFRTIEVYDTKSWTKKGVYALDEKKKHIVLKLAYFQNSNLYIPIYNKGSFDIDYYFKISLLNYQSEYIKCKNSPNGCISHHILKKNEKYHEGTIITPEQIFSNKFYVNGFRLNYKSTNENCFLEIKKENSTITALNDNIEKNTDYKSLGQNSMSKKDFRNALKYYTLALKRNQEDYEINYNLGVCHVINTIILKKEFDDVDKQFNLKSNILLENTDYFKELKKAVPYFEKASSIKKSSELDKKLLMLYKLVKTGDNTNIFDAKIIALTPPPIIPKNSSGSLNNGTSVSIGVGGNSMTIQNFSFKGLFDLVGSFLGSRNSSSSNDSDESSSSSSSSGSSTEKCVVLMETKREEKASFKNWRELKFDVNDEYGKKGHIDFYYDPTSEKYKTSITILNSSFDSINDIMKEQMKYYGCPTFKKDYTVKSN